MRLALAPLLLVVAISCSGCILDLGHCGKTLAGLEFLTQFPGRLTHENRTQGVAALTAMGFEVDDRLDGPGGVFLNRGTVEVFLQNGTSYESGSLDALNATGLRYKQKLEPHEYGEQTDEEALRQTNQQWPMFNQTADEFVHRTGWNESGERSSRPYIYIC